MADTGLRKFILDGSLRAAPAADDIIYLPCNHFCYAAANFLEPTHSMARNFA